MSLIFLFIATCLVIGALSPFLMRRPSLLPSIGESLKSAEPKRFSPRKTLFIIGPSANHPACRMQRRLLKPAIATMIREDVTVMEIYGEDRPRKNGEDIDWLDPALLRHAMHAEEGFYVVYVDAEGKTALRSEAPVVTSDLLAQANLNISSPAPSSDRRSSAILRRLRAA